MANSLETVFIFNDKDSAKIDALDAKLVNLDTKLNSLGQNPTFGQGITTGLTKSTDALTKASKEVDKLKAKTEDFTAKPTISRYYENEERVVKSKLESITASIDKAKASINPLTRPDLFSNAAPQLTSNQRLEFGKPDNALFENVRKTRLEVQKLNSEKIDTRKFDGLTQAGVRLHDQLGKAQNDILRINNALKKTNNKTVIDELNNDLVKAQNNFDKLSSRQQLYESRAAQSGAGGSLKLSSFQKQNLAYQVNDVATMAAMGANPTQIIASQGGQIAQIFNATQIAAFTAAYTSLVTVLGAGAAAIALTYKITGDLRAEAERRLKAEEAIAIAYGKQFKLQKESLETFKLLQQQDVNDRADDQILKAGNLDQIRNRKATAEKILSFTPEGETADRLKEQIRKFDAALANIPLERNKLADEQWKKSIEERKKAEEEENERQKQRITQTYQSVLNNSATTADKLISNLSRLRSGTSGLKGDDAVKLIDSYEKAIKDLADKVKNLKNEARDFLISVNPSENPLVKLMSDFATATERAEKKFEDFKKVLSPAEFKKFVGEISALDRQKNLQDQAKTVYGFQSDALKYRQEARRIDQLPLTQTFEFTRSLSTIERSVQFIASSTDLLRKSNEANFYAFRYNPNNPKSFNEARFSFGERDRFAETAGPRQQGESIQEFERRRQEAIESGINVFDAISDIKKFSFKAAELLTDVTDIYGQEIVANEIVKRLPSKEDLLKQLASPYAAIRENAQYLLSQQAGAFFTLREANDRKFQGALELQSYQDLRRTDFKEQINLLRNSTGLEREFALKQALKIGNELGLDKLDRNDRLSLRNVNSDLERINLYKEDEGRKFYNRIETYMKATAEKITNGAIKIDAKDMPAPSMDVTVRTNDPNVRATTGSSANNQDTHNYYRIGDVHEGGDLRNSTLLRP